MLNIEKYKDVIPNMVQANIACCVSALIREGKCIANCTECKKEALEWLFQEYKEPILDDVERKYLSAVIKPFRGRVNYIYKTRCGGKGYFIRIVVRSTILPSGLDSMYFPVFTEDTMYKGMVLNKTYTLKELGL